LTEVIVIQLPTDCGWKI